jgi:hypothetical protein
VAVNRPEVELLLVCARTYKDSERAAQIRTLLRKDTDWSYLIRMAGRHGMIPLLYWHLNATCPEAIPETVLDHLRDYFHGNIYRNLFLTGELLKLLNLFEASGIPAVPYKGPILAASVYGNIALREFVDLDILVHKQDVLRAKELLVSVGYQPEFRLTRAQEAALLRYYHEYPLTRGDGEIIVDLHWEITEKYFAFPLNLERLWGGLEYISIGNRTVPTLSPEDLLLLLCMHGSHHVWERLSWICDVAELIRVHKGMNWERVMERAAPLGSERMLFLGLFLASDLLGAALPEKVWQRVQADPTVKVLAGEMQEGLFRRVNDVPSVFEVFPFHLKIRERLRDRVRYSVRLATTTTIRDWKSLPLPDNLFPLYFPLYYVVRPIRLTIKYGRQLLGRLL